MAGRLSLRLLQAIALTLILPGAAVAQSTATLSVLFPGLGSVHTDVYPDDGVAGSVGGSRQAVANWRSGSATLTVPAAFVDARIRHGAATLIVDGIDCSTGSCTVDGITAIATVRFPGLSSVHTDVSLPDGIAGSAGGSAVTRSNWKRDATEFPVLRQVYDFRIRKGGAEVVVDDVDCTSESCVVDGLVAAMTVNFPGLASVHTDVNVPDGVANDASGANVTSSNWKRDSTVIPVFRQAYDLRIRKGGATMFIDDVDCSSGSCTVDGLVADMTVNFPGLSSVHTDVNVPDGVAGAAEGANVTSSNWKRDSTVIPVFRQAYDLRIRKGGATLFVDDVDCTAGSCTVDGLVAEMAVNFPGLSSVHTEVRLADDAAGVAGGEPVTSSNWKTDATVIPLFRGSYDLLLRKGAASLVVDRVDCTTGSCSVDGLVADMTVNFPGMYSVHTDVRMPDGAAGAAGGDLVTSSNWKRDATTIKLFPGRYDLRLRKGASEFFVDDVDCSSGSCSVDGLVADMTVNFPGMSSVHTDVRLPDGATGAAGGDLVIASNWKRDTTAIKLFPGRYDLRLRKGASEFFVDDVDCTAGCTVEDLVAEMTVNFPGMSSVHTAVRVSDDTAGSASGGEVTSSNWKSDATSIAVFPLVYDLALRKGGATQVVDDLDCRSGACVADDLVAVMTVDFPGMHSVHTDVRVPDGAPTEAGGATVTSSNWKKDSTTIAVFRQRYDLRLRKGGAEFVVDDVDCAAAACTVNNLVADLVVRFPGLSSVHTEVLVADGVEQVASGASVTSSNWKSQSTSIAVFRQRYDLNVRHIVATVFDDVDCSSGSCEAEVAGNVPVTLVDGDTNAAMPGVGIQAFEKLPDGALVYQSRGTTDAAGRIHFTLVGVEQGKVFTLKALNPFGNGKNFFSPFISQPGPQTFVVTADGENTLDLEPPTVFISRPLDGGNVSVNGFTVLGSAADNRSVDSVSVSVSGVAGNAVIAATVDAATGAWSAAVPAALLAPGQPVTVNATATDPARNSAADTVVVTAIVDEDGPVITFESHQDGDPVPVTGFLLSGSASDITGVSSLTATLDDPLLGVTVDALEVDVSLASGAWTLAVRNGQMSPDQAVTITLDAVDLDGNASSASIQLNAVPVSHAGWQVLNRITFGVTPALLQEVSTIGVDAFVEQQLDPAAIDDSALDAVLGADPTTLGELQAWMLKRMIFSRRQLLEVMTWFWDNHFNTDINTTRANADGEQLSDTVAYELAENRLFRANALGNFADLLLGSAQSPAMLIYLDSISNVAGDSNENYSREVKELHTLGVDGGYTEADVAAGAEVFTGWHLDPVNGVFSFDATRHNFADQTILGQTFSGGVEQGEAYLNFLARHPSTAAFVCTKLVTVFVDDVPPQAMVDRCATTFLDSAELPNQLQLVMNTILSNEFFEIEHYRAKIKTPVEFVVGALRNLGADSDATDLAAPIAAMGMRLLQNPVPTGFSEIGADWINSSLLIERIKWVNSLARDETGAGSSLDPLGFFPAAGFETAEGIVGFLLNLTVGDDFSELARQQALDMLNGVNGFDLTDADAEERLRQLIGAVLSYPGYQFQ